MLERDPLPGPQPGRGSEEHERPVARPELGGERIELCPGLERPLLRSPALRVVDAPLRRICIDQPPADGARQHLPERLRRLETMPGRDRHSPRRDLDCAKVADPAIAERAHGLREQPPELLNRLRLTVVLGEVDADELTQPRRLDQTALAPDPFERPLERRGRRVF